MTSLAGVKHSEVLMDSNDEVHVGTSPVKYPEEHVLYLLCTHIAK